MDPLKSLFVSSNHWSPGMVRSDAETVLTVPQVTVTVGVPLSQGTFHTIQSDFTTQIV